MAIVLIIVIALSLFAIVEAYLAQLATVAQIEQARSHVPVDDETGLLNHRAYYQRVTGELRRASGGRQPAL